MADAGRFNNFPWLIDPPVLVNLIGDKMNTDSAQLFVQKMREDKGFRDTVQEISDRTELWEYIENKGYAFDECDLVKSMAACMAELEVAG